MSAFDLAAFVAMFPATVHAACSKVQSVAKATICTVIGSLPARMWPATSWVVRKAWKGFRNA